MSKRLAVWTGQEEGDCLAVVKDIVCKLGLEKDQGAALQQTLTQVAGFKGMFEDLEGKLGGYSDIRRRLQSVDRAFVRLHRVLEQSRTMDVIDYVLGGDIEAVIRKRLKIKVPCHHVLVVARGSEPVVRRRYRAEMPWHLEGAAVRAYLYLIEELHGPVAARVRPNKADRHRGGPRGDWQRDLVIEKLAENCQSIMGRPATATVPSETRPRRKCFFHLCDEVLWRMRLPRRGLGKAIAAKLRKMKAKSHNPASKRKVRRRAPPCPNL